MWTFPHQNCSETDFQRQDPLLPVYPHNHGRYRVCHYSSCPAGIYPAFTPLLAEACLCSILRAFAQLVIRSHVFGFKVRMALPSTMLRRVASTFVSKHWHKSVLTRQLRLWVPPTAPEHLSDAAEGAVRTRKIQIFVC